MQDVILVRYAPVAGTPHVSAALVREAASAALSLNPVRVHPSVALSVARSTTKPAQLRLE